MPPDVWRIVEIVFNISEIHEEGRVWTLGISEYLDVSYAEKPGIYDERAPNINDRGQAMSFTRMESMSIT